MMSLSHRRRVAARSHARTLTGLLTATDSTSAVAVVERPGVRAVLLELHDVRARQGCDWRWMDGLPPMLRRELEAAITETGGIADDRVR